MLAMHALTWSACKWRRHRSVLCNNLLSRWGVKVYDAGDVIHMYESNSHLWPSMATCKCIPSHGPQHKESRTQIQPATCSLMVMGSIDHPFALWLPSTLFSKKCHFCDMLLIAVKCKFKQWQLEVTRNRKKQLKRKNFRRQLLSSRARTSKRSQTRSFQLCDTKCDSIVASNTKVLH